MENLDFDSINLSKEDKLTQLLINSERNTAKLDLILDLVTRLLSTDQSSSPLPYEDTKKVFDAILQKMWIERSQNLLLKYPSS